MTKNLGLKFTIYFSLLFLILACEESKNLFQENENDWSSYGEANWSFSNNILTGKIKKGEGYLITKQHYSNFELKLEFKPDSTINSGVFIRCNSENMNPETCYELNIWDVHPDQTNRTGAVVARANPLANVSTINQWNTYRILTKENQLKVWINDTLTIDTIDSFSATGYIGLQAKGHGEVSFRNINITTLN
ncbi:3-keto-disaccharide hydrolase [Winogradskyella endarachnes]|uniref:DUF1080 domain-containing protein n=1 Tax=Winogradskyella endarachnes TaxID=2681965 RepID=A0A6L6U7X7_9FLAO|nr:DUF1080 domain-containing protein [Winogradskyella endarachnes]MUU76992.1 DUF1080 domain-containing protein [Winogradskyella endarachnes]